MKCVFCDAPMGHDQRICPSCGKRAPPRQGKVEEDVADSAFKPTVWSSFKFRLAMGLFVVAVGFVAVYFLDSWCMLVLFLAMGLMVVLGPNKFLGRVIKMFGFRPF